MPKPGDVYLTLLPDLSTREAVLVTPLPDGGWLVKASGLGQVEVDRRQLRKKVGTGKIPKVAAKRHAAAPKSKKKKAAKRAPRKKAAKKVARKRATTKAKVSRKKAPARPSTPEAEAEIEWVRLDMTEGDGPVRDFAKHLTVPVLRGWLASHGKKTDGKKSELVERVVKVRRQQVRPRPSTDITAPIGATSYARGHATRTREAGVVRAKTIRPSERGSFSGRRSDMKGCGDVKKTYYVPASMLDFGGPVSRSYIASDFASLKKGATLSVRPFEWDGELWVGVRGFYGGSLQPFDVSVCQQLVPKAKYKGKTYRSYPGPRGQNYKGLEVRYKGKAFVLNNPACFVPQEHVRP